MSKLKPDMRVTYEVAKYRAMRVLHTKETTFANTVAGEIWPNHAMRSQGAGAAASRILKRMEKEGLVRWTSTPYAWGWVKIKGTKEYFETVEVAHPSGCNCVICFPRDNCPDCQACKRHAYSDATTPGFFYAECEKHRKPSEANL